MADTISRTIHQMWFDRTDDTLEEPPAKYTNYKAYMASWSGNHTTYQYIFWNGARLKQLWAEPALARWASFWQSLSHHIERCDFSRYALMYLRGGIYVDLDYDCLRPLDELIKNRDLLLFHEVKEHEAAMGCELVSNAIMASAPLHPVWPAVMDYIMNNYDRLVKQAIVTTAVHTTGPKALAEAVATTGYKADGDPCAVFARRVSGELAAQCHNRPLDANGLPIDGYAYTKWNEGTHWMATEYAPRLVVTSLVWVLIVLVVILGMVALWLWK